MVDDHLRGDVGEQAREPEQDDGARDGRAAGALAHQQPAVGPQQSSGVGDLVHASPGRVQSLSRCTAVAANLRATWHGAATLSTRLPESGT